ncbi:MAG TPA: energy-coupling factor transporter transmembrane component T [Candidatus Hydrogenedentes bacterium]|nr:energy-coupling factor transporter transmembrane component T [Candidatus Hydrogenedentota bacterium]HPG66756.1 energy-coupling factor transporter transmembrane component T [Candidatus Hydrogenedentota bacterium]
MARVTDWFEPGRSPLGRLDVRVKLALGFFISVQVVLAGSPPCLAILALMGLTIFALAWPTRAQLGLTAASLGLLIWGTVLSQGFFYSEYPRTVLVQLVPSNGLFRDGLNIYREGLRYGLIQSLRLAAVMLTGYAICFTTDPDRFLRGLLAMRFPFSFAFMAVTAIRFIPMAAHEFGTVRTAMRLKGYRPFQLGLRDTVATEIAGLRPVLAGAIRRSEEVALSIVTRGFAFGRARTALHEERLKPWHWGILAVMGGMLVGVAACKVLFWLYLSQIYYTSDLRDLYNFTRQWL